MIRIISAHTLRQLAARSSSTVVPPMRQQAVACFSAETVIEPMPVTFKEADDRLRESRKNSNKEDISQQEMAERNRVMEASRRGQMEAPRKHKPIPSTSSAKDADQGQWSTTDILSTEDGGGGVYQPGLRTPRDRDDILRESKGYLQNNDYIRPPEQAVPGHSPTSSTSSSSAEKGANWPQSAFDQKMQEKRDKDRQDLIDKATKFVATAKDKATPKLTDESKEILEEAAKSTRAKGKEFVEHPVETMGSQMKSAKDVGQQLFVDTKKNAKEATEQIKELTGTLKSTELVEAAKDMVTPKLTDESRAILKETAESTKAKGKEFVEHPIDTIGSQMESAKVTGEKLFADTKGQTKETAEKVKEATGSMKQSMPNSAESFKESAEEKGKQALTAAEAKSQAMVSAMKENGEKMTGKVQDKAKEKAVDTKEKSKEMLGQAQEKAKQAASKTKDQAMDTASSMWKKAKQMVSGGDGK